MYKKLTQSLVALLLVFVMTTLCTTTGRHAIVYENAAISESGPIR